MPRPWSISSRGYQLADAVYEVWSLFDGKLADPEGHFARLERSLGELRIAMPMSRAALTMVLKETVRQNRVREGLVYLQVGRGVAPRDHAFPHPDTAPSIVITVKAVDRAATEAKAAKGVSVITTPENRWGRCDIKTVGLLPNAMAKQAAKERGAAEAWFVDDMGLVTEGASSNAWIIDADGTVRTRGTNANILRGVTRYSLLDILKEQGMTVDERPFYARRGPRRAGGVNHRRRGPRPARGGRGWRPGWRRRAWASGDEAPEPLYRACASNCDLTRTARLRRL